MSSTVTRTNFAATAERFLAHLTKHGLPLRAATVEDARDAIAALSEGKTASTATQYTQRVKSLLSYAQRPYAHRLGYTPFNAGPTIRTKGGALDRAKRIGNGRAVVPPRSRFTVPDLISGAALRRLNPTLCAQLRSAFTADAVVAFVRSRVGAPA